ncbi:MAG: pantetheine-phosphate adenylyltransferase [Spirochaetia bacterium]
MSESYAIFPGSFDPPTYGHLDIVERTSRIFDKVHVLVSTNPHKTSFFSKEERCDLMKQYCSVHPNVCVVSWSGLIVNYAKQNNIHVIIRGIRPLSDFAYEFELATLNYQISHEVETLFLPTSSKYSVLRSSSLKEMAALGVDLSAMAPKEVIQILNKKLGL